MCSKVTRTLSYRKYPVLLKSTLHAAGSWRTLEPLTKQWTRMQWDAGAEGAPHSRRRGLLSLPFSSRPPLCSCPGILVPDPEFTPLCMATWGHFLGFYWWLSKPHLEWERWSRCGGVFLYRSIFFLCWEIQTENTALIKISIVGVF